MISGDQFLDTDVGHLDNKRFGNCLLQTISLLPSGSVTQFLYFYWKFSSGLVLIK